MLHEKFFGISSLLKFEDMVVKILNKVKWEYFYKSLKLIVFWVFLPIIVTALLLFLFQFDKLIRFISILN